MSIGRVIVDLLAKTGSFISDTDRAAKHAAKRAKEIDEAFAKAGRAVGAGLAIAGGAAVAMVTQTIRAADEINRFANIAGASTTEFQRMAVGASTVGIAQEKLSDQLKDFREKVGEFLATGGGGMKDFFEQVAPKIGITAEAFRNLSGPQALQLYVDSLEKAGVSSDKMSFYLESMASDSTNLIPLLRDGGRGFRELADQAQNAGAIIDQETVAASVEMRKQMDLLQRQLEGVKVEIAKELIPTLNDMARSFIAVSQASDSFFKSLGVWASVSGADERNPAGAVKRIEGELARLRKMRDELDPSNSLANKLNDWVFGDVADLDKQIATQEARLRYLQKLDGMQVAALPFVGPPTSAIPTADRTTTTTTVDPKAPKVSEAQRYLDSLKQQLQALDDLSTTEKLLADIQIGRLGKVTEAQRAALMGVAQEIDTRTAQSEADKRLAEQTIAVIEDEVRMREEIKAVYDATRTPAEQLAAEIERLNKLVAGGMDWGTYTRAVMAAQDSFDRMSASAKSTTDELDNFAKHAAENIQDHIADGLVDATDQSFREILANFGRMIQRMLAEALAADIGKALFGDLVKGGSGGGMFGNLLKAFAGAAVGGVTGGGGAGLGTAVVPGMTSADDWMLAGMSARAFGGPVTEGTPYLVGERGVERFVPNTSGRIVPNNMLGGGGSAKESLTIINQTSGRIDKVTEQRLSPTERALIIQEAVDAAWAQPNDPNSRASRTLSRNFSLNRSR